MTCSLHWVVIFDGGQGLNYLVVLRDFLVKTKYLIIL